MRWRPLCLLVTLIYSVQIAFSGADASDPTSLRNYAVEVSASIRRAPPQITLQWVPDSKAISYTVQKRSASDSTWGASVALGGGATTYSDNDVAVGVPCEYRLTKIAADYVGYGYVYSAIDAPLEDIRGKLILLVEAAHAGELSSELAQFENDLAGDGWTVMRHDIPRSASVASVKAIIKSDYDADPRNVRSLFIFGHLPVPYSGNIFPDGHTNHQGAWPADAYYAEMHGPWTDNSVNATGAERRENWNVPGDGKFDQSILPSDVELEMGRVDLADMTAFSNKTPARSERDLLRQYLQKNHNFRHRQFTAERRALIVDHFGLRGADAVVTSGWRNFSAFFGSNQIIQGAVSNYLAMANAGSYLWSYGAGGGSYYYSAGVATSDDFALNSVQVVFGMFLGSYYGDWNNESNFLRAFLGSSGYTLAAVYAGFPHWFCHHMALGKTIGYSTRLTQNNAMRGNYPPFNQGTREVHIALMGDPTLRLHPVIPPADFIAASQAGSVALRWTFSNDTDLQGYHIYRGPALRGPFVRLTDRPVPASSNTFMDTPPGGTHVYMVRAVKLERSASGSYFNASQGIFAIATVSGASAQTPPTLVGGERATDGNFLFRVAAAPNDDVAVDVSSDLRQWVPLLTNKLSAIEMPVVDSGARSVPQRFYRARLVP